MNSFFLTISLTCGIYKNIMKKNNYILPDQKIAGKRNLKVEADRKYFTMSEEFKNLGSGLSYFVRTYGCQANVRDGESIAGLLQQMDFVAASTPEDADLLIFNTCAIRKAAEDHVLGEIGNLKQMKLDYPDKIYALCGCMAQEESIVKLLMQKYPQVDLVFGTHNIYRLPHLLKNVIETRERTIEVFSEEGSVMEHLPVDRNRKYKGFVNIMYGCNKFCTYCIVPYTRGKERSRRNIDIIEEVRQFKENGGIEVTLLGQNVNAYGKDLGLEDGFADLLAGVAQTGIERIRFYTSHPKDYTASTIDVMRQYPNIMKSLHLPVQSGSNEILKRMNRGYTVERYFALFDDLKSKLPEITFTTDLIVGFPGETDAQFEETLKLVDYCKFDSAFSFIYSPREGTPAARMEDDIPAEVKKERLRILNERLGQYAMENNRQYLGKTLKVLCDGASKRNDAVLSGYSEENKLVNFTAKNVKEGDVVLVKITDTKSYTLDGVAVE